MAAFASGRWRREYDEESSFLSKLRKQTASSLIVHVSQSRHIEFPAEQRRLEPSISHANIRRSTAFVRSFDRAALAFFAR